MVNKDYCTPSLLPFKQALSRTPKILHTAFGRGWFEKRPWITKLGNFVRYVFLSHANSTYLRVILQGVFSSNHNFPGEKRVCQDGGMLRIKFPLPTRFCISGTFQRRISRKEDNFARYTKIFENFLRGFSFRLTLQEFSVECFAFRKCNSVRILRKRSHPEETSLPFPHVWKLVELSVAIESISSLLRVFFAVSCQSIKRKENMNQTTV